MSSTGVATRVIRMSGRSPAAQWQRQVFTKIGTLLSWKLLSSCSTVVSAPPTFARSRVDSVSPSTSLSRSRAPSSSGSTSRRRSASSSPSTAQTWLLGKASAWPSSGIESLPPTKPLGKTCERQRTM